MLFNKKPIIFLFFSVLFMNPIFSQTRNSLSTGSTNKLSINLTNTMGVRTTANGVSNVEVDNEAVLILDPASKIQDSFNSDGEGLTGDFVVSPNGASFNIKGLQAENNYIIGNGSYFKSSMKSLKDTDPSKPIKGDASASLLHSMTLTVDQTNSSFSQAFSQDF
tara:strand:+ start:584 stop:1075 length:492 start_codon:yes stop_codon:yes gene_type:complete